MSLCRSLFYFLCVITFLSTLIVLFGAYWLWEIKTSGELILDHAPSALTIMREADTQIIHVSGDDWHAIAYGQGFASA